MPMPVFSFSSVFARFPDNPDQLVRVLWKIRHNDLWVQINGSWRKAKETEEGFAVILKGERIVLDFLRTDYRC